MDGDAERRAEAHIPAGVGFATKGEIARDLLARAFAAGVPARWVVGDTVYGADELRRWLEGQGRSYVLAVAEHACHLDPWPPADGGAVGRGPARRRLDAAVGRGGQLKVRAGMTGRVWRCPTLERRARPHWLLARRSLQRSRPKLAYYRVYGPVDTPVTEMVRVAGRRWTIEEGFEQAKGEVGLDQYEVRRYDAWYRYITLALLAHAALEVTRASPARARPGRERGGAPTSGSR